MLIKQARAKHKKLHGDEAVSISGFYNRVSCRKRPLEKAIKTPKGVNWGGPRPPKRFTVKNFRDEEYPEISIGRFYQLIKSDAYLAREYSWWVYEKKNKAKH